MDTTNATGQGLGPITPQDRGALGINNAKAFLTALAGQVMAGASLDANRDGTISTSEWTGFGTGFILAALGNLSTGRAAFPEFGDLKGPEFGELTAHVLNTDFLPGDQDQAEQLVKLVLLAANANRLLISGILDLSQGRPLDFDPLEIFGATFGA
jgi:hypothetical protein